MKSTRLVAWKMPKNLAVAPEFDTWNQKYEPWAHLKAMGRLVGTGFYIPPEWYNHFRMFPPQSSFHEEQTLNPHNEGDATQVRSELDETRAAVRAELGRRSRTLASEGMRYYNLFWVKKPIDEMERKYFKLTANGASHENALKMALEEYQEQLATKKRVSAIQAEEAKLSGNFITMREASAVVGALAHMRANRFAPHHASVLASEMRAQAVLDSPLDVQSKWSEGSKEETTDPTSSEALFSFMDDDGEGSVSVTTAPTKHDRLVTLKEQATGNTGDVDWYTGAGDEVGGLPTA